MRAVEMIGDGTLVGFHAGSPNDCQPGCDRGAGQQAENTTAGDVHCAIGPKTCGSARAEIARRSPQIAAFCRAFLTFAGCGVLTAALLEKSSFRPADRPLRPEVNARQRDAPSGAKVFWHRPFQERPFLGSCACSTICRKSLAEYSTG